MASVNQACPAVPSLLSSWQVALGAGVFLTASMLAVMKVAGQAGEVSVDYPIFSSGPAACTLIAFLAPPIVFGLLDMVASKRAWAWLGKLHNVPELSTSEPERPGAFLLRPWNSHSSNAQIAAGVYIFTRSFQPDTRAPLASMFLGLALLALGLFSYAWWGSRSHVAWFWDNLLMEVHTLALSLLFISVAFPSLEMALVGLGMAYGIVRSLLLREGADLVIPTVCSLIVATGVIYQLGGDGSAVRLAAALGTSLCGLAPKIADIQRVWRFGTSLFHYMEAFAFTSFFLWAQTLPLSK